MIILFIRFIFIFLDSITIIVFVDMILSWVTLILGIEIRPKFISDILDPIYIFIKKYIPTTIGIFELAPMVLVFGVYLLKSFLFNLISSILVFIFLLNIC